MSKKHKKEHRQGEKSEKMSRKEYESELTRLEIELVKLQAFYK